jgi:uncharacterized protein with HEPN domain
MRRADERLQDIIDAIAAINRYAMGGKDIFEQDELIQVWIAHHLQIIGEAVNALPADLLDRYPEIPWARIVGFRNIVVHEYFQLDLNILWAIVQHGLPPLQEVVNRMFIELNE